MNPNVKTENPSNHGFRTFFITAIFLSLLFGAGAANAQLSPCPGAQVARETYLPINGRLFTNAFDSRTDATDTSNEVKLRGSLHFNRAPGETLKNRPVLIFNHGHEQGRGEACAIVSYFVGQKWVVFVPLRRGHFLDKTGDGDGNDPEDVRSTGIYIDNYVTYCSRSFVEAQDPDQPARLRHIYCGSGFCRAGHACDADNWRSGAELSYLREQRIDIRDQIAFIKSLAAITPPSDTTGAGHNWKLADANSIVIMGHSYGGALTVLANAHDYGQSVAIDIAGGELSWDNEDEPYWDSDLSDAMRHQERPIFMFQAKNGKSLSPTKELFSIGVNNGFRVQAAIFGPAPACADNDTDGLCDADPSTTVFKDIHGNFIGDGQVEKWGPAVIEFAKRHRLQ